MTRNICLLRSTRLATKLFLAAILTFALCVPTSAAVINVNVMVHGFSGMQTIGTICTQTGTPTSDVITADFTFSNSFKGDILDGWYNFRWVQVVTGAVNLPPVFPVPPFIDPQPGQAIGGGRLGDYQPYYDPETRVERVSSRFYDRPRLNAGQSVAFDTFFVVEDITAGDFNGRKFSVLAGFNWSYTGGTGGTGVSTYGTEITINEARIIGIQIALENKGTFENWTALGPQTLRPCPEPASLTVFGFGTIWLVGWGRRRRRKTEQLDIAA